MILPGRHLATQNKTNHVNSSLQNLRSTIQSTDISTKLNLVSRKTTQTKPSLTKAIPIPKRIETIYEMIKYLFFLNNYPSPETKSSPSGLKPNLPEPNPAKITPSQDENLPWPIQTDPHPDMCVHTDVPQMNHTINTTF